MYRQKRLRFRLSVLYFIVETTQFNNLTFAFRSAMLNDYSLYTFYNSYYRFSVTQRPTATKLDFFLSNTNHNTITFLLFYANTKKGVQISIKYFVLKGFKLLLALKIQPQASDSTAKTKNKCKQSCFAPNSIYS